MRIPASVFVMSMVTAVPFGLGIRDTLNHRDVSVEEFGRDEGPDWSRRSDRERDRALEEYEAEVRREDTERAAKARLQYAKLDMLYDATKPAQMGPLFDGIRLGADAGSFRPEPVRQRIETATSDGLMFVSFDADAATLNALTVTVHSDYRTEDDPCEKLGEKLAAAWGTSPTDAWLDPVTRQRATYDEDNCKLTFERYLEPTQWVAQLPLSAVGMSAEKLSAQLGPASEYDDDRIYWTIPGIGFGKGTTKLEAFTANRKVIGFKATVTADFDTTVAVRDALSAKLKVQPNRELEDDRGEVWEWKRRVPVSLEQLDTDRFSVLVGKMPWD